MAEPVALRYRAFISYSHADTSSAKWLHRGLEGFRIDKDLVGRETTAGTIPTTLRPIFRDRDDFTAGHTLNEQTLAALDASSALIVVCSPASAKSRYVNEELRLFKSRHPERPVVPLIVDGKPGDPELDCFPPALKFKLGLDGQVTEEPVEVLAADAREEGDGKNLAVAKVVARLLGLSSDDVFRRAERERRRQGPPPHGRHCRAGVSRRRGLGQRGLCLAAAQDQRGVPQCDVARLRPRSSTTPSTKLSNTACPARHTGAPRQGRGPVRQHGVVRSPDPGAAPPARPGC